MKNPQKNDRILILAPHPDDEILAAGGYIYRALKNKAKLKVVIVTFGENFGYAIGRGTGNFLPINKKCQEFAKTRANESIKILTKLGLKKEDVTFLGFPDKSLKFLWRKNWSKDKPYYSALLKTTSSPFKKIYREQIIFCGEELLESVEKILASFKPTIIINPSSYDDHPDHKTLSRFTQKAILNQIKKTDEINLYAFLIHKNYLYPLPYGLHPNKGLNPPLILRKKNIIWKKYPLNEKAILAKEKAILSYKTQVTVMEKRLLSFLRQNELFEKINL